MQFDFLIVVIYIILPHTTNNNSYKFYQTILTYSEYPTNLQIYIEVVRALRLYIKIYMYNKYMI